MAGGSLKKIQEKNKGFLQVYSYINFITIAVFFLEKAWFYYLWGEVPSMTIKSMGNTALLMINQFIFKSFHSMAKQGSDLGQTGGLTSFLVDVMFINWFVVITTTILSDCIYIDGNFSKIILDFVWILALIPVFGFIKLKALYSQLFGVSSASKKKK